MTLSTRKPWSALARVQTDADGPVTVDTFAYPDENALAEAASALALKTIHEAFRERGRALGTSPADECGCDSPAGTNFS